MYADTAWHGAGFAGSGGGGGFGGGAFALGSSSGTGGAGGGAVPLIHAANHGSVENFGPHHAHVPTFGESAWARQATARLRRSLPPAAIAARARYPLMPPLAAMYANATPASTSSTPPTYQPPLPSRPNPTTTPVFDASTLPGDTPGSLLW